MWVAQASVEELDEMYSLVEALMGGTRSLSTLALPDRPSSAKLIR